MSASDHICVALDSSDRNQIQRLAQATEPFVGAYKIGLTAFAAHGPATIRDLVDRKPVFADLKLHDIPVQVRGATEAVGELGARFVSVHASGGRAMVEAAVEGAGDDLQVLGVTVLTSLDEAAVLEVGWTGTPSDVVVKLAEVALAGGAHGLVCSPHEVARLRAAFGPRSAGGPWLVVPGIRSATGLVQDQRRTAEPGQALADGADLLVVGRPITAAPDPGQAAQELLNSIEKTASEQG